MPKSLYGHSGLIGHGSMWAGCEKMRHQKHTRWVACLMLLLLGMAAMATTPTVSADHSYNYEATVTWSWVDRTATPPFHEFNDVGRIKVDFTCWAERDCEGEVLVDTVHGSASCFIERGDSWFHGTIRVRDTITQCKDVWNPGEGSIQGIVKTGRISITNPLNEPNVAGTGSGPQ